MIRVALALGSLILLSSIGRPAFSTTSPINHNSYERALMSVPEKSSSIVNAGSTDVRRSFNPHFGHVVEIPGNQAMALRIRAEVSMDGGTISFWVRPQWAADSLESHTFLSARWDDSRQSYMAISQGWWEPGGSNRLYFIVSNEDIVHCSSDRPLPLQVWSLITATWESGKHGFCKLYVDDELRATTERTWVGGRLLEEIAIGSDQFASNSRGRRASASIGAFKILEHPVTHHEVIERYRSEEDLKSIYGKKWAWLDKPPGGTGTGGPKGLGLGSTKFKRVIFDEDMSWATSFETIDQRLQRIRNAGFNVYVPCVWHGHGVAYPSPFAARDPRLNSESGLDWDPLAYLLKRAHALGIAVYPWFTVMRREDTSHPEWAEHGVPEGAYDVHQPLFRAFVVQLMLDAVTRYDLDGINLDYIRAMGVCLSALCQVDYRTLTGFDLLKDYANGSPEASARSRIQNWQDVAVGNLVSIFSAKAHSLKPQLIISVDGVAVASEDQRPLEGRNEIVWANRDWIDVIFHMDYRPVVDIAAAHAARTMLNNPAKLWLLVGNYDMIDGTPVPRSGEWVSRVVEYTKRLRGDAGVGIYLYSRLSDGQVQALR